ncbi:MAG TPA: hypothetical protein VEQ11_10625 [Chloroflexota bacterium]|nr:hypothetical protein [Chloroflexota bacterium]
MRHWVGGSVEMLTLEDVLDATVGPLLALAEGGAALRRNRVVIEVED